MAKYVVGTVDEIPVGGKKVVEVAGRKVGVFNVNGEYFALLSRCPHQAGPLCEGRQYGLLVASVPGEYEYSRPGEFLRCPWHGWEFDVRTGQSWFDPAKTRVRQYEVNVQSGKHLLADTAEPEPEMGGLAKGPYTAETYPVSVEQEYVVVDIGS